MSSAGSRVVHVFRAELPYIVIRTHHASEVTEHGFATMRDAEAFIKRNTPVRGRALSPQYDGPESTS